MEVLLDTRENELIEYFKDKKLLHKVENLDVGDYQVRNNGEIMIIVERKSLKDLSASIKDGRYKEQKLRLSATGLNHHNIVFLIEGNFNYYKGKWYLPKSTLLSSILNTLFRDGFSVLRTQSFSETCEYLEKITKTSISKPENIVYKKINQDYNSTIQVKKKLNMTPEVCFYNQLITIPKISKLMAKYLVDKHGSMIELCKYYESIDEEKRKLLIADEKISTTTGKLRKIGKVASTSMYNYIYCCK